MEDCAPRTDVQSEDPLVVETIVVTTDDVITALEATERRETDAVLRVTPPFSGRMRARLHIAGTERNYETPEPIHVPPDRLVEAVPAFPTPDDTEDDIRSDARVTYSPAVHRRRHEAAVSSWRDTVRDAIVEQTTIETTSGALEVEVVTLA